MSEAELHLLKQRMYQGTLQTARRGALSFALPIGYVHNPAGEVVYDPDEQVQHVVRLLFRKFDELGTLYVLLRYLNGMITNDKFHIPPDFVVKPQPLAIGKA